MDAVTRTLKTIAAIRSGQIHAEVDSRRPTEPLRSQKLSASSLGCSNRPERLTASSATSKGTANSNGASGAAPIAEPTQAAFAGGREIRIDKRDRVVVAPARDVTRHRGTIITAASLALALCLGWIAALYSDSLFIKPASLSGEKATSSADPPDAFADSKRLALQASSANTNATATIKADKTSNRGAQTKPLLTKQPLNAPQPRAVERTNVSTKPASASETRPTTIEGWTLLQVKGSTAVLEGPNGIWRATRGDTVPGVGKIDSIVRWGNRWIVATGRGLISTR
jgi:hypothetical protein